MPTVHIQNMVVLSHENNEKIFDLESDDEGEHGVNYEDLRPTYTHEALAKLMHMGILKYAISQNGDGLHTLSGKSF